MFTVRDDEPAYAFLDSVTAAEKNAHGNPIDLIASSSVSAGSSLYINADPAVGSTENRNKQHGFHFTADNCIGCHACEAACSEKNDLPAHLSFRSVGYVEGGTYPDLTRMNLSMACNHCDDPVCLKGCPTNAYTKHSEYGAVLQDPDACFGCGYCTWVCPYNAPQLDPIEGVVQKCNMCVDRLEVGLKPACVSACVGNALDFGVIETTPENREQAKTCIPGFPDPEITQPNIRFQQTKALPQEFSRPDSQPIRYRRDDKSGNYEPTVDSEMTGERQWNLSKLNSKENPLVVFTLVTQAVVGAFSIVFLGALLGMESLSAVANTGLAVPFVLALTALQAFVLFLSTQHLGKPLRFYRGFNNLRYSPLSREALAISLFLTTLPIVGLLLLLENGFAGLVTAEFSQGLLPEAIPLESVATLCKALVILAACMGVLGLYYMHKIYRIKARPFWDHWQVLSSFFGSMFSVGSFFIGMICLPLAWFVDIELDDLLIDLLPFLMIGLAVEMLGHVFHARDLLRIGREGGASMHVLKTRFGKTYLLRNSLLAFCLFTSLVTMVISWQLTDPSWLVNLCIIVLGVICLIAAVISRALFYVLVIPTTMPGAFFWKNQGFEEHARETGLAKMPQVGVVDFGH
jgi:DMSO reductase iron-sulfur subunit